MILDASGLHRYDPVKPPTFELYVQKLGLTPEQYVGSKELRRWCAANMYRKFVPEILLNTWKLYVDPEDERLYGKESND
jgi:hypothetical protein